MLVKFSLIIVKMFFGDVTFGCIPLAPFRIEKASVDLWRTNFDHATKYFHQIAIFTR